MSIKSASFALLLVLATACASEVVVGDGDSQDDASSRDGVPASDAVSPNAPESRDDAPRVPSGAPAPTEEFDGLWANGNHRVECECVNTDWGDEVLDLEIYSETARTVRVEWFAVSTDLAWLQTLPLDRPLASDSVAVPAGREVSVVLSIPVEDSTCERAVSDYRAFALLRVDGTPRIVPTSTVSRSDC